MEKSKPVVIAKENTEVQEKMYKLDRLKVEIGALQKKADIVINMAETKAGKIIEKANFDATNILNINSIEGYKKGIASAKEKTDNIILSAETNMKAILERAEENTEKIIQGLESEMLNLSFDIAEKIIGCELDRNSEAYVSIINKGIATIKSDTKAKVYMQSEEFLKVKDNFKNAFEVELLGDNNLEKGDIIIETEKGKIEAGTGTQLDKIKKVFNQDLMSIV